jgi:hypothetical protein
MSIPLEKSTAGSAVRKIDESLASIEGLEITKEELEGSRTLWIVAALRDLWSRAGRRKHQKEGSEPSTGFVLIVKIEYSSGEEAKAFWVKGKQHKDFDSFVGALSRKCRTISV